MGGGAVQSRVENCQEREKKGTQMNFFRGFRGQEGWVRNGSFWATQSLVYCLFPAFKERYREGVLWKGASFLPFLSPSPPLPQAMFLSSNPPLPWVLDLRKCHLQGVDPRVPGGLRGGRHTEKKKFSGKRARKHWSALF